MTLAWHDGSIVEKQVWTEGLFTIRVNVPDLPRFESGQFLQVGRQLVVDGEETFIYRPYSVASPWGETIEFFVVVVEDGVLTPRLWELDAGDEIKVGGRGAGRFTLKHTPPGKHLWLVATGTGLAPYIAILRDHEVWDRYERVFLVHGVRYARDLAYAGEFRAIERFRCGRFRYVPATTREPCPEGICGRITALLKSGSLEDAAGAALTAADSIVMLCGNPAMIEEMMSVLQDRGLRKHRSREPGQLVVERYW